MRQKLVELIIGLCLEQHGSAFGEIVNGSTAHAELNSYTAREKVQEFGNMNGGTGRPRDNSPAISGRSMPKRENNVNKQQSEDMVHLPETSKHFMVEIPARETGEANDYHQPHSLCSTSLSSPPHISACTEGAGKLLLDSPRYKQQSKSSPEGEEL